MTSSADNILQYVKIANLKDYLEKMGWTKEPFPRNDVIKFRSPDTINAEKEYIDTFIPVSDDLGGSKRLLEHALRTISSFEDKDVEEVIIKVLVFADHLKSIIIETKKGMIPLDSGVILYGGLRDLIISSAAFELDPSAKRASSSSRAKKYASDSLIGRSDYGSYVANIYIPLEKPNRDFDFTKIPFQRKVVLRILNGLGVLTDAINEQSSEPIIKNYTKEFNFGMCDAMIDLIDAGGGNNVIVDAILEPAYKSPQDISTEFTLNPRGKRYLKEAIDVIRVEEEQFRKEGQWSGFPRLLDRPEKARKGLVKLQVVDADKGHIDIFIKLNEADY